MASLDEIVAASALVRSSQTKARDLRPGDRVLFHRAPPGSCYCTEPRTGTVIEAIDTRPEIVYPKFGHWRVTIRQDDGEIPHLHL